MQNIFWNRNKCRFYGRTYGNITGMTKEKNKTLTTFVCWCSRHKWLSFPRPSNIAVGAAAMCTIIWPGVGCQLSRVCTCSFKSKLQHVVWKPNTISIFQIFYLHSRKYVVPGTKQSLFRWPRLRARLVLTAISRNPEGVVSFIEGSRKIPELRAGCLNRCHFCVLNRTLETQNKLLKCVCAFSQTK